MKSNEPSLPAAVVIDVPLASFRATSVVLPWVVPLIRTCGASIAALFFGELTVIFGGVRSRM